MKKLQMVDLTTQQAKIKQELDTAIADVINTASYINGPAVQRFSTSLSGYLDGAEVVPCANGTDALQIALMAAGLQPGDDVIVPAFSFAATAEVVVLLGMNPVYCDVHPQTFNIDVEKLKKVITPKTKAILPVHLFGQCADMEPLLAFAKTNKLFVIEDMAQALGATYKFSDGIIAKAGTMGHFAGLSFFPSKNLGCFGDGGAVIASDAKAAKLAANISNHGQTSAYTHTVVGINSRLDSMQAAILDVKIKYLPAYTEARRSAAKFYNEAFRSLDKLIVPYSAPNAFHVFHQYTLILKNYSRSKLLEKLAEKEIPCKVYYPIPLHLQKAYNTKGYKKGDFPVAENLCNTVFSLPMHTELDNVQLEFITKSILEILK